MTALTKLQLSPEPCLKCVSIKNADSIRNIRGMLISAPGINCITSNYGKHCRIQHAKMKANSNENILSTHKFLHDLNVQTTDKFVKICVAGPSV